MAPINCESWRQISRQFLVANRLLIRSALISTVLSVPLSFVPLRGSDLGQISQALAQSGSLSSGAVIPGADPQPLIPVSSAVSSPPSGEAATEAHPLTQPNQGRSATPQVQARPAESSEQLGLSQQMTGPPAAAPNPSSLAQQTGLWSSAAQLLLQPFQRRSSAARPSSFQSSVGPFQPTDQRAQAQVVLTDIQGHWAQSFIQPLIQLGVIQGFPDGGFRPNQAVTRVQFAAMVRKAFAGAPAVRSPIVFTDVSPDYWGYTAIQEAYTLGFLRGFPDNSFQPNKDISRVQVLVALASGLNLTPIGNPSALLNASFADAPQVPDWAGQQVAAATEQEIVVNYPEVSFLRPNRTATRADVAAFIHQALVSAGSLPTLTAANPAVAYIVGFQPPEPSEADIQAQRQQLLLPIPPVEERAAVRRPFRGLGVPGSSISTPTAFGADWGDVFVGGAFQERTRFTQTSDGAVGLGFGLGDAQRLLGLEIGVAFVDLEGDTFQDGGFSFKVHRQLPFGFAIAGGVENVIRFGDPDGDQSGYGVVSKIFQFDQPTQPFSALTTSVGFGGGRFRQEDDLDEDVINVFGSLGLRVFEPVSAVVEWSGQDLNAGLSIAPFRNLPLVITPAAADITDNAGDGVRFILGVGFGANFRGF